MLITVKNNARVTKLSSVKSINEQYYFSLSATEQIGGEWLNEFPAIPPTGRFLWLRNKIVYTDDSVRYSNPVLSRSEVKVEYILSYSADEVLPIAGSQWSEQQPPSPTDGTYIWMRVTTNGHSVVSRLTGESLTEASIRTQYILATNKTGDEPSIDQTGYIYELSSDTYVFDNKNYAKELDGGYVRVYPTYDYHLTTDTELDDNEYYYYDREFESWSSIDTSGEFAYFKTKDTSVDPTKVYYIYENNEYIEVDNPVQADLIKYYERVETYQLNPSEQGWYNQTSDNYYEHTADTEIITGKEYYKYENGFYILVTNPIVSELPTYYEKYAQNPSELEWYEINENWTYTVPTNWQHGKYIWARSVIISPSGAETYGSAYYDSSTTQTLEDTVRFEINAETDRFSYSKRVSRLETIPFSYYIQGFGDVATVVSRVVADNTVDFVKLTENIPTANSYFIEDGKGYFYRDITSDYSVITVTLSIGDRSIFLDFTRDDITGEVSFLGNLYDYPTESQFGMIIDGDCFNLIGEDNTAIPYIYKDNQWYELWITEETGRLNCSDYPKQWELVCSYFLQAEDVVVQTTEHEVLSKAYTNLFANKANIKALFANKVSIVDNGDLRSQDYTTPSEDRINRNFKTDSSGYLIGKNGQRLLYEGEIIHINTVKEMEEDEYEEFTSTCEGLLSGSYDKGEEGFYIGKSQVEFASSVKMKNADVGGKLTATAFETIESVEGKEIIGARETKHYVEFKPRFENLNNNTSSSILIAKAVSYRGTGYPYIYKKGGSDTSTPQVLSGGQFTMPIQASVKVSSNNSNTTYARVTYNGTTYTESSSAFNANMGGSITYNANDWHESKLVSAITTAGNYTASGTYGSNTVVGFVKYNSSGKSTTWTSATTTGSGAKTVTPPAYVTGSISITGRPYRTRSSKWKLTGSEYNVSWGSTTYQIQSSSGTVKSSGTLNSSGSSNASYSYNLAPTFTTSLTLSQGDKIVVTLNTCGYHYSNERDAADGEFTLTWTGSGTANAVKVIYNGGEKTFSNAWNSTPLTINSYFSSSTYANRPKITYTDSLYSKNCINLLDISGISRVALTVNSETLPIETTDFTFENSSYSDIYWYKLAGFFSKTSDTEPVAGKTYYSRSVKPDNPNEFAIDEFSVNAYEKIERVDVKKYVAIPIPVDEVDTYQDLLDYDTSTLSNEDVIKVLNDSAHGNRNAFYKWVISSSLPTWVYEGTEVNISYVKRLDNTNLSIMPESGKAGSDYTLYINGNNISCYLDGVESRFIYSDDYVRDDATYPFNIQFTPFAHSDAITTTDIIPKGEGANSGKFSIGQSNNTYLAGYFENLYFSEAGALKSLETALDEKADVAHTHNYAPSGISTKRDFTNGTLITTNIDYSVANGNPFYMEIKGNVYGRKYACLTLVQGYIYNSTIINYGVTHSGGSEITGIKAMNIGGNLCFWFPRQSYWEGYSILCTTAYDYNINKVTSVTDVADPSSSATKVVNLSANTYSRFPVGSTYLTFDSSFSPSTAFGGTWSSSTISVGQGNISGTGYAQYSSSAKSTGKDNTVSYNNGFPNYGATATGNHHIDPSSTSYRIYGTGGAYTGFKPVYVNGSSFTETKSTLYIWKRTA